MKCTNKIFESLLYSSTMLDFFHPFSLMFTAALQGPLASWVAHLKLYTSVWDSNPQTETHTQTEAKLGLETTVLFFFFFFIKITHLVSGLTGVQAGCVLAQKKFGERQSDRSKVDLLRDGQSLGHLRRWESGPGRKAFHRQSAGHLRRREVRA